DPTANPDPTKAPTPTPKPDPTKAPTPTPTPEPTAEPEPVDEPDDEPVHSSDGKFGDTFKLESEPSSMDYAFNYFLGVYCQNTQNPAESFFFPYLGDVMEGDTLDENNYAYIYYSPRENGGQLRFLKKDIIDDEANTKIEDSQLLVTAGGKTYSGEFYWDYGVQKTFVCLHIDEYNIWFSSGGVEQREVSENLGVTQEVSKNFTIDPDTELFTMDTRLFGLSYSEFCDELGRDDLMAPEDWPWWGTDLKVVYVDEGADTIACFFQNDSFVIAYRDGAADVLGDNTFSAAAYTYGQPDNEYDYWSGYLAHEWYLSDCTYDQHVEVYNDNEAHYRQQYTWSEYTE
ncbi:MAG: hypothetical protein J6Y89_08530, partial [Lachnospiraceae bacterium]|nr:hypothetical protein [Lachnospiraceae bacterium]